MRDHVSSNGRCDETVAKLDFGSTACPAWHVDVNRQDPVAPPNHGIAEVVATGLSERWLQTCGRGATFGSPKGTDIFQRMLRCGGLLFRWNSLNIWRLETLSGVLQTFFQAKKHPIQKRLRWSEPIAGAIVDPNPRWTCSSPWPLRPYLCIWRHHKDDRREWLDVLSLRTFGFQKALGSSRPRWRRSPCWWRTSGASFDRRSASARKLWVSQNKTISILFSVL